MEWIKEYTDSDSHPQMIAAGFWGRQVFRLLCRLSGQYDLNGAIPAGYLTPDFLVGKLGLDEIMSHAEAVTTVTEASRRVRDAGLISRDGLAIPGWENRQSRAMSSAERARKYRESKRTSVTKPSRRVTRSVTPEVERESEIEKIKDSVPQKGTQLGLVSQEPPKEPKPQEIVFAAWKRELRKPDLPMGRDDFSIIGARLKDGCTVEQLCLVPVGARRDAERWPERRAQDEIKFLFGSLGQVRKFVDLASAQVIPRGESSASNFTENRPPPGRVKV